MITEEALAVLEAGHQLRPQMEKHLLERLHLWVEITNQPKLEKATRNRPVNVQYQDDELFNPDVEAVHLTYRWDDGGFAGGWGHRVFHLPKRFLFDEDGAYEQTLRAYKALEADLQLPKP